MKEKKLSKVTIASYAMSYGSGYQIMGSLVGSYLMVFLTDTFGIPAAAVGVIMVLASIWDAINDPMMGVIADKTKTRFGKYRPYFLFVPALLTVVVVLLFASPNLSPRGKIIWTAVFYVGYGMLRTAIEIPCNAIINAVTNKESERSKMISAYTFTMGIFTTITTSFALSAVSLFGGENTAKGYMIVVGFAGILMTISCLVCFANTKEKYMVESEKEPVRKQLATLFRVKGLILTVIIWLAGYIGYNVMMASSVYYVMYCICRPDLISAYMLVISVCGLAGIVVMIPLFMRYFHSVKKGFVISQIGTCICNAVLCLFGSNLAILFVFSALASMFATMFMVYGSIIMTEMSDYTYYTTGRQMNGTIASLKGFTNKCGIAISSGVISAVLAATGYIANAIGAEPQATVTGITLVRFLCPLVMAAIMVITLHFYPITEETKKDFANLYDNKNEERG
jgi:sugar (glycoside-pentoside-hexuronide) transporter